MMDIPDVLLPIGSSGEKDFEYTLRIKDNTPQPQAEAIQD
jgi:hypothetical protein